MYIGYFDESKKITIDDQKSDNTLSEAIDGINLAIKICSSMVSSITKQALNKKREQDYKLGRDFGFKNKRYIWEGKEEEIKNKLMSGMSRLRTAKEVGISIVSLYDYLKINPELKNITENKKNETFWFHSFFNHNYSGKQNKNIFI